MKNSTSQCQLILPSIDNRVYRKQSRPPLIPNYHYIHNNNLSTINPHTINHTKLNTPNKPNNPLIPSYPSINPSSLIPFPNRSQSANINANSKRNAEYNTKIPNNQLYLSNELMSKSMLKQYKNEQMYISQILSKDKDKYTKERNAIQAEFTKKQQYNDHLDYQRIRDRNQIISLNKDILQMQIKQKRLMSFEKKKELTNTISEMNEKITRDNIIYELEKNKNERIKHFYKKELEGQIVVQLIRKIEKDDERMSNRSRIKNRLLVNDYINTYNKDDYINI